MPIKRTKTNTTKVICDVSFLLGQTTFLTSVVEFKTYDLNVLPVEDE